MAALAPHAGNAQIVGLTGSPGVGKSTSTNALVERAARRRTSGSACSRSTRRRRSPAARCSATGSGCRTTPLDRGVYIRSMASRGHLGGLAWATPQALRVLDAAGCDVVLVETVGVGQSEVEIAGLADTTLVLLAPGMGDGIQAAKAGILEIGDVFVVNKADRDGADQVRRELRSMLALGRAARGCAGGRRSSRPSPSRRGRRRGGRRDRPAPRLARVDAASSSAGVPAARATRSRRSR